MAPFASPARLNLVAEANYLTELVRRRLDPDKQGLRMESLDGKMVFADHHGDAAFNPASVIKIATSFAALERFGPDYKFETTFLINGAVNAKTKTLKGDLILQATGDPLLTTATLNGLIRQIARLKISRVNGDLLIAGPFTFGSHYKTDRAASRLAPALRKLGVRITGKTRKAAAAPQGKVVATHTSPALLDIVFDQNAHSTNSTAERLGEVLGGPKAVEEFLVRRVGIAASDVRVGRTSGLDFNRITPRATVQLLRQFAFWLDRKNLRLEDVMPVAGIDPGTLRTRFRSEEFRGAVVGKTGTLPATEGGVSTLAGMVYTRNYGPVLFAIFNTKGSVNTYRQLQDELLMNFIMECGGMPGLNASLHRSDN